MVLRNYAPGDVVWVQDYHLMLLPALLKLRAPKMKVPPRSAPAAAWQDSVAAKPWHPPCRCGVRCTSRVWSLVNRASQHMGLRGPCPTLRQA